MKLRPYQIRKKQLIYDAWNNGAKNILDVLPCGGGKTVVFSEIILEHDAPACAIAHRQELVGQISLTLAKYEIRHRIIGPKKVIRFINKLHIDELGKSYYKADAPVGVAGVDTLTRGSTDYSKWLASCTLWTMDEAHHILKKNKWGKAAAMFPNAKGLGPTATAERSDRMGLGRKSDGIMDVMIPGPSARDLIDDGYLTDYRIYNPDSNFDRSNIPVSELTGEFTQAGTTKAVRDNPQIIGNIVKHYKRIAMNKLGVTFVPSVDIATDTANEFKLAGIPSAVVHADTPTNTRVEMIRMFRNREILQLVNVDLFGEGFDLPAIEVVQMARATKSWSLYHQQFMRALRLLLPQELLAKWDDYTSEQRKYFISQSTKPYGIIIDHVNNIDTERGGHGLPDVYRKYSLDRGEKRCAKKRDDVIPTRTCIRCTDVYLRIYKQCPSCNFPYIPASRSEPEFVDGDLTELDPITLAKMREEIELANMTPEEFKAKQDAKYVADWKSKIHVKQHIKRLNMQEALQMSMAWWAGYQRSLGRSDSESYKRFYFAFGIDVLTAQTLKTKDANMLADKINHKLGELANG